MVPSVFLIQGCASPVHSMVAAAACAAGAPNPAGVSIDQVATRVTSFPPMTFQPFTLSPDCENSGSRP